MVGPHRSFGPADGAGPSHSKAGRGCEGCRAVHVDVSGACPVTRQAIATTDTRTSQSSPRLKQRWMRDACIIRKGLAQFLPKNPESEQNFSIRHEAGNWVALSGLSNSVIPPEGVGREGQNHETRGRHEKGTERGGTLMGRMDAGLFLSFRGPARNLAKQ